MKSGVALLLLGVGLSHAVAGPGIPGEVIGSLPSPWPPAGWSEVLALSGVRHGAPHRSEPQVHEGYFGQNLYRVAPDGVGFWTANVLIQDRGDAAAAWRAVSAIHRCSVRVHLGNRARECRHTAGSQESKTLYYQSDRFYITIQVSGPGDMPYPEFNLGHGNFPPRY